MKPLAIALLDLRRVFRDRSNIFFVIITPFMMVFLMGLLFGGGRHLQLGVAGGGTPLADRLVTALGSPSVQVARSGSEERLLADVERGRLHGALVIPAGYDATLRAGGQVEVRYVTRTGDFTAADLGSRVRWAVSREAAVLRAARFGAAEGGSDFDGSLRLVASGAGVEVKVVTVGRSEIPPGFNQFAFSAPPLLLLYTFLTALTTSIGLVQTRLLGISRRMYASPTPARAIVAGEAAGRLVIALVQSLLIMLGSAVLFGVDWGDPLGAAAMVLLFALVGGGAATLVGALVDNEGAAISLSVIVGLGLGALGGTMVPLDSFEGTLRTVAYLTPHAWGYDGFAELVRHGAGLPDILPQLGVLAAYAAVLFALGIWRLRRALVR